MVDARYCKEKYDGEMLFVYLPERETENLIVIEEGTGDNLLPEDRAAGYVDYVNYGTHTLSVNAYAYDELEVSSQFADGGMVMFEQMTVDLTIGEIVRSVLNDVMHPQGTAILVNQ